MIRYLSSAEFAERIGVSTDTLKRYRLPEPDAITGRTHGCPRPLTPGTLDGPAAAIGSEGPALLRPRSEKPARR